MGRSDADILTQTDDTLSKIPSVQDGQTIAVLPRSDLQKQLNIGTLLCLAFVICNSWAGVSGSLQLALLTGGPATLIYGIILSTIAYFATASSLAELASVYPTAGGQYHFASILSPPKFGHGISYACGMTAMFSWIAIGVTVCLIPAQQIMALIAATHEGFQMKTWHVFLVYEGLALLGLLFNLFALKRCPWIHAIGFLETISLFIVYVVAYFVRAHPKATNEVVWATFINGTGWPDGLCFIIGLSTSCFMYIGLDASMHMAEECAEPRKNVPRVMMMAVGIGFITAFVYTVALLYALPDIEEVLTSTAYVPFLVAQIGFRSTTMAVVVASLTIVMTLNIIIAVQETSSRMAWSLSRDDGLVFSSRLKRIHPFLQVPDQSLLFTWALTALCGCLYLASTTAINALVSSAVLLQQISFMIPVALLLYHKRAAAYLPKNRVFKLPSLLGWAANSVTLGFGSVITVVFCFPILHPITASSMNYASVVIGTVGLLELINWFSYARNQYHGPTVDVLHSNHLS